MKDNKYHYEVYTQSLFFHKFNWPDSNELAKINTYLKKSPSTLDKTGEFKFLKYPGLLITKVFAELI